jgi:hypothetical protein
MSESEMMEVISDFRAEVADVAEVEEQQLTDRLRSIHFRPRNPDAIGVWLAVKPVGGGRPDWGRREIRTQPR